MRITKSEDIFFNILSKGSVGSMLGATVNVGKEKIITCAPRYNINVSEYYGTQGNGNFD